MGYEFMRPFQRRRDAKRIQALEQEVTRLRHKLQDAEKIVFDVRSEHLGERIYEMALNQQDLRIAELEAQVARLQVVALLEWEAYYNVGLHHEGRSDADARRHADEVTGLLPGDLDPVGGEA